MITSMKSTHENVSFKHSVTITWGNNRLGSAYRDGLHPPTPAMEATGGGGGVLTCMKQALTLFAR